MTPPDWSVRARSTEREFPSPPGQFQRQTVRRNVRITRPARGCSAFYWRGDSASWRQPARTSIESSAPQPSLDQCEREIRLSERQPAERDPWLAQNAAQPFWPKRGILEIALLTARSDS